MQRHPSVETVKKIIDKFNKTGIKVEFVWSYSSTDKAFYSFLVGGYRTMYIKKEDKFKITGG